MKEGATSCAAMSHRRQMGGVLDVPVPTNKKDLEAGIDALKESIREAAEKVMNESIPSKIGVLSELYAKCVTLRDAKAYIAISPSTVTQSKDDGPVALNTAIGEINEQMKREILIMVRDLSLLRVWLRLNQPKIEDGNNFGVAVQEEILAMLNSGRVSGLAVLGLVSKYHFSRGKRLTQMRKHPNIQDYYNAARDMDEKQFINLCQSVYDLRTNYALLHDKISKNKEKLLRPKGEDNGQGHMLMY